MAVLLDTLKYDDPDPCDGCEQKKTCKLMLKACPCFVTWVDTGRQWSSKPRVATRHLYNALFPNG